MQFYGSETYTKWYGPHYMSYITRLLIVMIISRLTINNEFDVITTHRSYVLRGGYVLVNIQQ